MHMALTMINAVVLQADISEEKKISIKPDEKVIYPHVLPNK